VIAGAFKDVSPGQVPDANSTIRIVQQVGGSFGAAVLAVILASELFSHHALTAAARGLAFDTAFRWAISLTALTLGPALLLPDRQRKTPVPARPELDRGPVTGGAEGALSAPGAQQRQTATEE
jgi:hypothetical protein